jgi:hypothetical protein
MQHGIGHYAYPIGAQMVEVHGDAAILHNLHESVPIEIQVLNELGEELAPV